jgi:hypothetical protein
MALLETATRYTRAHHILALIIFSKEWQGFNSLPRSLRYRTEVGDTKLHCTIAYCTALCLISNKFRLLKSKSVKRWRVKNVTRPVVQTTLVRHTLLDVTELHILGIYKEHFSKEWQGYLTLPQTVLRGSLRYFGSRHTINRTLFIF